MAVSSDSAEATVNTTKSFPGVEGLGIDVSGSLDHSDQQFFGS